MKHYQHGVIHLLVPFANTNISIRSYTESFTTSSFYSECISGRKSYLSISIAKMVNGISNSNSTTRFHTKSFTTTSFYTDYILSRESYLSISISNMENRVCNSNTSTKVVCSVKVPADPTLIEPPTTFIFPCTSRRFPLDLWCLILH